MAVTSIHRALDISRMLRQYQEVRTQSERLAAPLSDADATAQSMPDASPAKWHLAHTTWFFETMILKPYLANYQIFDASYNFLFNSYYETIGKRNPRPDRGFVTRPSLDEIVRYRHHVDDAVERLISQTASAKVAALVELGCHHEQQHQELLLTDILHLFSKSALCPAYKDPEPLSVETSERSALTFTRFDGGVIEIGHDGDGFHFDCEGPRHEALVEPFGLADRTVTNGEFMEFIADGGYRNPLLWLSAGWADVLANGWERPFYWEEDEHGEFSTMTLRGRQPVDPAAPAVHLSYFEADAFAAWAGKRLPNEMEWEHAARNVAVEGNFVESGRLRPRPTSATAHGIEQMFGDVWEWTRSAFSAYPRFRPIEGAIGEYNGKFMCGQFVLRGGSCATPQSHIRATYRNFFPPDARWQFSGLRLAEDA